MIVYVVSQPGAALGVLPGHPIELDGRTIRENNTIPDDGDGLLRVGDP